jgi:hypothetical protein
MKNDSELATPTAKTVILVSMISFSAPQLTPGHPRFSRCQSARVYPGTAHHFAGPRLANPKDAVGAIDFPKVQTDPLLHRGHRPH